MLLGVFETGGTINGIVDPAAPPPADSRVLAWLGQQASRLHLEIDSQIVVMKDSRSLEDTDRERLAAAIETTRLQRILIPHGTYTMPATGMYLRRHLGREAQSKSIVLVGSMVPLGEAGSDAPAALEFAIETLGEGPVGVWIAMNGRIWHPAEVVKDDKTGDYVARDPARAN
ncbi:MAG: asparaginase domain-containing protein [Haliea sp.]|uniref:asparaginase domain-containing protein n=1 Tax=Haliea sp. TaxID=1932666 RepID=UPI0032ECEDA2